MEFRNNRALRVISTIVLVLFIWTFCGIFEIVHALQNNPNSSISAQQSREPKPEERFEKAIKDVEDITEKLKKVQTHEEREAEKEGLRQKRQEIEGHDAEIRKQFIETEKKIKEAGLPSEILDRHYKFVKHYEDNLNELKRNFDDIEKAETKSEIDTVAEKIKAHLEKTKPPSRHTPSKASKPPNRVRELKRVRTSWLKKLGDFLIPSVYAAEPPPPSPADLAETLETPLTQEIREMAAKHGNTPVGLYEYVRNTFKYEPYVGSVKGAIQTLRENGSNEWDLASLLIALYRASGIPARYVVGTVEIPIEQAMSWLGVDDANIAADLLYTQGRPTSLIISGGRISVIRTQHVWVQAYVPFLHTRGATSGPGDTWIDIDPSFKTQTVSQTLSLNGIPSFDQTNYLSTLRTESPLDFYRTQLQNFLDTNASNYVAEALSRNLEIVPESLGILIGQLPYKVLSVDAIYSAIPSAIRQKFTLTILDNFGFTHLTYTAPLPALVNKRITLSYAPATSADASAIATYGGLYATPPYLIQLKPQVKLDGQIIAEGNPIGAAQEQKLEFHFESPTDIDIVQNTIIAGEYYAIALNAYAGSGSHQEIIDRAQRLAAIQDTINLNDPTTLDDRLGEVLYLSAILYHQNLNMAERKMAAISSVIDIKDVSEMMYFLTTKVDYFFGIPKKMTPVSITADMDRNSHLIIPIDGDLNRIKPYAIIEGNHASYLEHNATEKMYKTEALSAVKGIQLAHDQNIPVHTVTAQNINILLPTLQISEQVKTDIQNAIHSVWYAIVPAQNLVIGDWIGVGYILQNPENGEAYYRIEGGHGGAVLVHAAFMQDMVITALSDFASNADNGAIRQRICFPGLDNWLFSKDDTCYTTVTFYEACGYNTRCQNDYAENNPGFARPLIAVNENGPDARLTKYIKASDWQSQDGAPYMRVGLTVLTTIEFMMDYFKATNHDLLAGSGYRTQTRNSSVGGAPKSHHPDGVAADIKLTGGPNPPNKCDVLNLANYLIGGKGEVLHEGKPNTVHIAIHGKNNRDNHKYKWSCQ